MGPKSGLYAAREREKHFYFTALTNLYVKSLTYINPKPSPTEYFVHFFFLSECSLMWQKECVVAVRELRSLLSLSLTCKLRLSSHLALLGINSSFSKLWIISIHTLQSYLTESNEIYANEFCEIFYTHSIINELFCFCFSRGKYAS